MTLFWSTEYWKRLQEGYIFVFFSFFFLSAVMQNNNVSADCRTVGYPSRWRVNLLVFCKHRIITRTKPQSASQLAASSSSCLSLVENAYWHSSTWPRQNNITLFLFFSPEPPPFQYDSHTSSDCENWEWWKEKRLFRIRNNAKKWYWQLNVVNNSMGRMMKGGYLYSCLQWFCSNNFDPTFFLFRSVSFIYLFFPLKFHEFVKQRWTRSN